MSSTQTEQIPATAWFAPFGEMITPGVSQSSEAWNELYHLASLFKRLEKLGRTLSLTPPGPDVNAINESLTSMFEFANDLFNAGEPELRPFTARIHSAIKGLRRALVAAGLSELARPRVRAHALTIDQSRAQTAAHNAAEAAIIAYEKDPSPENAVKRDAAVAAFQAAHPLLFPAAAEDKR